MTDRQVSDDLAGEPDLSLLQHFDKPQHMGRLEELFTKTLKTFGLSKEELKTRTEFNLNAYETRNFESVRGVFRLANALSDAGFTNLVLLDDPGLADLMATKDGQCWFVEVKTLVLQVKPQDFDVAGKKETFAVDKFQPQSCNIADYVEKVSRILAGNHIQVARGQLLNTVEKIGPGNKMIAVVVNLFAADFFLDPENLNQVGARLRGKVNAWEKDYLADIEALAFLTNQLHFVSV